MGNDKISPTPKAWQYDRKEPVDPSLFPIGNRYKTAAYTENLRVIAIDPGGVTGWSVMDFNISMLTTMPKVPVHNIVTHWYHGQVECGQGMTEDGSPSTEVEGIDKLNWLIEQSVVEMPFRVGVVIESFSIRRFDKSRQFLSPVRITAPIQQQLFEMGICHDWTQTPNDAKDTIKDERLKAWDMYSRDGMQHARDADRHALLALRKLRANRALLRQVFPVLSL